MSRIKWNVPEERFFDAGLDRGVLYPRKVEPIGPILANNLFFNPSFEYGSKSGWDDLANGNTGTVTTTVETNAGTFTGTKVCRVQVSAMGNTVEDRAGLQAVQTSVVPNAVFTVGAQFGGTLPVNRCFRMFARYYTAAGAYVSVQYSTQFTSNGMKKHQFGPVPATAATARIGVYMEGMLPSGAARADLATDFWVDRLVMLLNSTARPAEDLYFDGDSPDTGAYAYTWAGTPGASVSQQRERVGVAVPWNGLVSVEEEAAEGAASYYVDGRPFLHLPRPKEYKATLNAYTYPDAFAEIMGVAEVADGMYLDSQMGLAFDLCYRTQVGNGLDGLDHGYKLHLVYNATVVPGGLSFESLSDSINATTFSWDIQAVPVQVEGFRPTAHIIIDTRHMDQATIDAVEKLLYGDETNIAHMPTPQVVFDLLSFGDTIIVTDNGDGTFDVTGSYENVYMVGDGEFRVDNVDGQDNGDGTFTISSTNV